MKVVAFAASVLLAVPGAGQTPSELTVFLDLIVEDGRRRPALDLKPEELVIAQDGVRQRIAVLKAVGAPGRYEVSYVPASGKASEVKVQVLRAGHYVRGLDGPGLKPRVAYPLSPMEAELAKVLETRPDAADFRSNVSVLRFESAPDGLHHTLAVEVPLAEILGPSREGQAAGPVQILARVADAEGREVYRSSVERSLAGFTAHQRLVWTAQRHLAPGRYELKTVVRDGATARAAVRQVSFEAPAVPPGVRVSSVALLLPHSAQVLRDKGREEDDPLFLKGQPLMPTLDMKTVAAPGARVEFFAILYPDRTRTEPVTARLDLVRGGDVVGSVPLQLPPPDERGEIRYVGALPTHTFRVADYRLRVLAQQGDSASSEEAGFSVLSQSDAPAIRIGEAPAAAAPTASAPAREGLPDSPELAQARRLLHRQQYGPALEKLRQADEAADRQRGDVALLLSFVHYRAGNHKKAEADARRAIELSKDDPGTQTEAYLMLGRSLAQGENKSTDPGSTRLIAAEDAFRRSLGPGGGSEMGHLGLAETLFRLEREDDARTALQAFLAREGISDAAAARARQLLDNPRCAAGACLPRLSFVGLDGRKYTNDDLQGKVVMLSFWATWCGPCVAAMPDLKKMHARYENEPFVMVGVNRDDDRAAMDEYVKQNGIRWPQIVAEDSDRLQQIMAISGIPAEIVFDHDGVLIARTTGWSSQTETALGSRIRSAIGRAKKAVQTAAGR